MTDDSTAGGPGSWVPNVPDGHPADRLRRLGLGLTSLASALLLLSALPVLAPARTPAGWGVGVGLAAVAVAVVWGTVSNQRLRRRSQRPGDEP